MQSRASATFACSSAKHHLHHRLQLDDSVAQDKLRGNYFSLCNDVGILVSRLSCIVLFTNIATAGDKTARRRNQRADKAASVAALLQHAISDDRFAVAVQDLEASFGTHFSGFITGLQCCMLVNGCCVVQAQPLMQYKQHYI